MPHLGILQNCKLHLVFKNNKANGQGDAPCPFVMIAHFFPNLFG